MKHTGDQYVPHQEKRWHVSEDEISRERIKALKEIHDYFKEQVPGVTIGLTLFGSLSKGKELNSENVGSTDIDTAVFVDNGELIKNFTIILEEHPESEFIKFAKAQAEDDKELHPTILSQTTGVSVDFIKNTLKEFVQNTFKERFGHLQNGDVSGKETAYLAIRPISLEGEASMFSVISNLYSNRQPTDDRPNATSVMMARYFHLDVGGSMKKYKENFYRELAERLAVGGRKADFARSLWSYIVLAMKNVERPSETLSPELQEKFPSDNLEEFLKKQNIPIPENQDHI